MTIHLIKLCVGADSLQDLLDWERERGAISTIHTRNMPKRRDELLATGSLYWVIKGVILCRRKIVSIEPVKNSEKPLVHIGLDTRSIMTEAQARRPFQGWRYLTPEDAPKDIDEMSADVPTELQIQLKQAGVW